MTAPVEPVQAGRVSSGERVLVAMSGGVDSSVAAALLREQGLEVVGVTMRLHSGETRTARACCTPDDVGDARDVADRIGAPFFVADFREEFDAGVLAPFVRDYAMGRTPSPCVLCNSVLKFDLLVRRAEAVGARSVATGHYARVGQASDGRLTLERARDRNRDQSYFLFAIRRSLLPRLRFPLGEMSKQEVRARAAGLGLTVADKPDSQDLCFAPPGGYAEFVAARLDAEGRRPGALRLWPHGDVLGSHSGIHRFTIGQRRGLGLDHHRSLRVRRIDAGTGDVWLAPLDLPGPRAFRVRQCNWLRWETPPDQFTASVQIRSRHRPCEARVVVGQGGAEGRVVLVDGGADPAPGQAAVFYDRDEVLGGGWIDSVSEEPA